MRSSPPRADELARINATIRPREPRCELLDTATHEIWMAREPVPRAWFDALILEPPLVRAGYGAGTMDRAWFRRSPGAPGRAAPDARARRPPLPARGEAGPVGRAATLEAAWEIALPAPTETGWLANGASFQGPVRAPMV